MLAAKSEGSEFGVPPIVYGGAVFLNLHSKILNQSKVDKRFRNSGYHPVLTTQAGEISQGMYMYSMQSVVILQ